MRIDPEYQDTEKLYKKKKGPGNYIFFLVAIIVLLVFSVIFAKPGEEDSNTTIFGVALVGLVISGILSIARPYLGAFFTVVINIALTVIIISLLVFVLKIIHIA